MLFYRIPKTPIDKNPQIFINWRLFQELCHSPVFNSPSVIKTDCTILHFKVFLALGRLDDVDCQ